MLEPVVLLPRRLRRAKKKSKKNKAMPNSATGTATAALRAELQDKPEHDDVSGDVAATAVPVGDEEEDFEVVLGMVVNVVGVPDSGTGVAAEGSSELDRVELLVGLADTELVACCEAAVGFVFETLAELFTGLFSETFAELFAELFVAAALVAF